MTLLRMFIVISGMKPYLKNGLKKRIKKPEPN